MGHYEQQRPTSPTPRAPINAQGRAFDPDTTPDGRTFTLLLHLTLLGLVGMIKAAVAANRGEFYRYPMTIRFV